MALSRTRINALLKPYYPGEGGRVLEETIAELNADILTLKAWADALAAKLNLDGGVTGTDYAVPNITTKGA
jgi:hypothetical protein